MKIYNYLRHFPPRGTPIRGGTALAVHGLSVGLAKSNVCVGVLCEGSAQGTYKTGDGFEILSFPSKRLLSQHLRIAQNQITGSLNIVILHGIFNPSVFLLSHLLCRSGVPYICAPHDPYTQDMFVKNSHLKWPYWFLFERRVLTKAIAVQVLDLRHEKYLRQRRIQTPVIEVPNGVMCDGIGTTPLQWRKHGQVRLMFLGRMDLFNKGLDILIKSCLKIQETCNVELTIQGPDWGDKGVLLRMIKKLGLKGRVLLLDPDYTKSSEKIIAEHDIFCLASRYEGFGLAALEAMMAARVLLVTEIAGIAPHVHQSGCGVVVKPEISSVARGLEKLISRRHEWREMGLAGRKYALEQLTWKQIAIKALDQYSSLAKGFGRDS